MTELLLIILINCGHHSDVKIRKFCASQIVKRCEAAIPSTNKHNRNLQVHGGSWSCAANEIMLLRNSKL